MLAGDANVGVRLLVNDDARRGLLGLPRVRVEDSVAVATAVGAQATYAVETAATVVHCDSHV